MLNAKANDNIVVFQGTVLNLSLTLERAAAQPSLCISLRSTVSTGCAEGSYSRQDMTVDHLILSGSELDGVKG